jgi:hypothetical protein
MRWPWPKLVRQICIGPDNQVEAVSRGRASAGQHDPLRGWAADCLNARQELSRQRVGLASPDNSDTHDSNGWRCPASTRPQDCESARPARPARQRRRSYKLHIGGIGGGLGAGGVTGYTVAAPVEDWRRRAAAPVEDRSRQTSTSPSWGGK